MCEPRHIAPAAKAPIAAVGQFERDVTIWDLDSPRPISAFSTVLDFGGRRLALTPDGSRCLAAAYHVHGLACYDSRSGDLVWARRDLKKIQRVGASIADEVVMCFFDAGPAQVLRVSDGETVERIRAVRDVHQSVFSKVDLFEKSALDVRARGGSRLASIPRSTFALLSACFSPSELVISESGGPVRFFELPSGKESWRYEPEAGRHVLELTYSQSQCAFFGVEWPYQHGGPMVLLRLESDEQAVDSVAVLGTPAKTAFCRQGEHLLTSSGHLLEVRTLRATTLRGFTFRDAPPNQSLGRTRRSPPA